MRRLATGIGGILLFWACVTLVASGLVIIFKDTPRPLPLGWLLLALSFALIVRTTKHWTPALPGVIACGVLNCLIMLLSGHPIGQPNKPLPQPHFWILTDLLIAIGLLATKLAARTKSIDVVDRVTLASLVVFMSVQFLFESLMLKELAGIGMVLALAGLLVRHPRHRRRRRIQMDRVDPGLP